MQDPAALCVQFSGVRFACLLGILCRIARYVKQCLPGLRYLWKLKIREKTENVPFMPFAIVVVHVRKNTHIRIFNVHPYAMARVD